MIRFYFFLFFSIITTSIHAEVDLNYIIKQITKNQIRQNPHIESFSFKDRFNFSERIPINQTNDTIFIREHITNEDGYGTVYIWNGNGSGLKISLIGTDYETCEEFNPKQYPNISASWEQYPIPDVSKNMESDVLYNYNGIAWITRIIIHNGFASFEFKSYPF